MGYWKERQLEEQERGYAHTGAFACARCIGDKNLAAIIDEDPAGEACSYCGRRPTSLLDNIIGHAINCLSIEYRPESSESPPWDNEDRRYIVTPVELGDLIRVHMDDDPRPELWEDIESALHDEPWFERNAYATRPHDQLLSSWKRFSALVTRTQTEKLRPFSPPSDDPDERIETADTLDTIGEALAELPELLVDYPAGMVLWRVRPTDDPGGFRTPLELAPPRAGEQRGPQRMSVDGVNWFYGASTADLAVAEKFRPTDLRFLALGRFETTSPMTLLDLSDEALQLPSIFDPGRQTGRLAALFLHGFAEDIAQPIDDSQRHRYRPTQLMTEFIRTQLPVRMGQRIDGVIYPSARGTGHNIVLFHGRSACIRRGTSPTRRTRLAIDEATIETLDHLAAEVIARSQQAGRDATETGGRRSAWSEWALRRLMLGLPAR